MREKVRDRGRLEHILEAIESIEEYHAQYTFEDIKKNKLIFYGFTKLVEVIGEAVYMLSTEFRDSHSDVNWRQIERMRHVLVHGYYTILLIIHLLLRSMRNFARLPMVRS